MCSCLFKSGSVKSLKDFESFIPQDGFAKGETRMLFRFFYCVGGNDVINKALENFYVKQGDPLQVSSEDDMDSLAQLSDSGKDVQVFGKSIKQALENIQFTQDQLNNASCKVAFATGQ